MHILTVQMELYTFQPSKGLNICTSFWLSGTRFTLHIYIIVYSYLNILSFKYSHYSKLVNDFWSTYQWAIINRSNSHFLVTILPADAPLWTVNVHHISTGHRTIDHWIDSNQIGLICPCLSEAAGKLP